MAWKSLLINPPSGDPALLLILDNQKNNYLIDCGDLHRARIRHLQRVNALFITHTHIDHFIGFDQLIRIKLFSKDTLKVYGPAGITECVTGKLKGYAWNLTSQSQFKITVHELLPQAIKTTELPCCNQFTPTHSQTCLWDPSQPIPLDPGINFTYTEATHNVPCLAYRIKAQDSYTVNKTALHHLGLPSGPWLQHLKSLALNQEWSKLVTIETKTFSAGDLTRKILTKKPGASLAYVSDTRLDPETKSRLIPALKGSQTLWCEASYTKRDQHLAVQNLHLSSIEAAQLAKAIEAETLYLFHHSKRYPPPWTTHLMEASEIFPGTLPAPVYENSRYYT